MIKTPSYLKHLKEEENLKIDVLVTFTGNTSREEKTKCSCPAGASSYCNHVMALLFENSDYSVKGLTEEPQKTFCTSQARKRGFLGESGLFKEPIMSKAICKDINKKVVNSTLFDPRNKFNNINFNCKLETLESLVRKQGTPIVFSRCITALPQSRKKEN